MPLLPVASVVYGPDDLLAAARALIDSSSRRIIDDPEEADVACPLLDDGVCSIRPDRPLACREYLVTSDPKHCAPPGESADQVVRIRSATDVVGGFAEVAASFNETKHYILAFALADAAANGAPERPEPQARSGPRTAALLTARTIAGSD
ncbi:MAG: hypothetical protein R2770_01565 [Acidimicrobiales bacterium]